MIEVSISNFGIFSSMDYWYEIVKRYDEPKRKDPKKKEHATYSQTSVVILLIYLTFGEDYPFNIARYFKDRIYRPLDPDIEIRYPSNLMDEEVGTLLDRMKDDELVTVTMNKSRVNPKKTYSINPKVIQSPIKDGTYSRRDGSIFEIPLEMIEQFLPWRDLQGEEQEEWSGRDGFFNHVVYEAFDKIDFFFFISFLQSQAKYQNLDIERNRSGFYMPGPSPFEKLLADYYKEMEELFKNPYENYVNPFKKKKK